MARRRDRLDALAGEIETAGGTALVVAADIGDQAQAENAVAATIERFGRLDTVINNAGPMLLGRVVGADGDDWNRMIAVNLTGTFHCIQSAVPDMLAAKWGRIVTISSS